MSWNFEKRIISPIIKMSVKLLLFFLSTYQIKTFDYFRSISHPSKSRFDMEWSKLRIFDRSIARRCPAVGEFSLYECRVPIRNWNVGRSLSLLFSTFPGQYPARVRTSPQQSTMGVSEKLNKKRQIERDTERKSKTQSAAKSEIGHVTRKSSLSRRLCCQNRQGDAYRVMSLFTIQGN